MFLAERGVEVTMFDFTGYGFSSGARGIGTLHDLLQDLSMNLLTFHEDLPLFLMGHSMGGGSVLSFARLNPHVKIAGIIGNNPFIDFPKEHNPSIVEKTLIHFLPHKALSLSYNPPNDPFKLSNNPIIIQSLFTDPLIVRVTPFMVFKTLCNIMRVLKSRINDRIINFPLLLMVGEDDNLTELHHA